MTDPSLLSEPREPIAIIGIGCRFPTADGPEAFWQLIKNGIDTITEMPRGRFDADALYDPLPGSPGKIVTRQGGFLKDIDLFDPYFFGISPREAACMDPQQRLLLEVAWEAFEDAGVARELIAGSRTGVFVGMWTNEYEDLMFGSSSDIDLYVTTGGGRYAASGRLSYVFDLRGPSLTLDTACSSSLVAVHLACQSLWSGESEMALAGGVNLILQPHITIGYSKSKMLSPDARCRFGDAHAKGYVRSEGVGLVLLKPLSQALADKDPIYALIRGSAVNNDGRASELLVAPSSEGQEAMLREAYRVAGVSPENVQYMEAHGTGTRVGDPVELHALGAVLSIGRSWDRPCKIGSVKTNIGHTEAASGIAGLIKVALCLKNRALPPSLHLQEPNPQIPWQELPLVVQQKLEPWPETAAPAFAAVNSFGVTGTNAHVVMEAPTTFADELRESRTHSSYLLPLSAHTPEALLAVAHSYQTVAASLHNVCYTASIRRTHHEHRLALVVHSHEELIDHLQAFLQGESRQGLSVDRRDSSRQRKVVFVFPGQGSQWVGMGRQLLEQEPVFRGEIERCEQAFKPYVSWSLLRELTVDHADSQVEHIDIVQPTLFAIQVALAALWRSWGIEPAAVVGHSMGEVAACHVAGVLSLEDAARIICQRSRLMRQVSGQGAMAMVELSLDEARALLADGADSLSIAVSNSPRSTVLSGDVGALDEILAMLEDRGIFCRRVKVDVASHSPHMEQLRPELLRILSALRPRAATIPIYSTVTGQVADGKQLDARYWGRNLRDPVLFSVAMQRLLEDGYDTFIEISPHPILLPAVQQNFPDQDQRAVLPSLQREADERAVMLGSLGALYTLGYPIDWHRLYPAGGQCVRLPTYPWQRERFWFEPEATTHKDAKRLAHNRQQSKTDHPLLGQRLSSSLHQDTYFWELALDTELVPFLADHCVNQAIVLPAAAYLEMVLTAATEVVGAGAHTLENVSFIHALILAKNTARIMQVVLTLYAPGIMGFRVSSRLSQDDVESCTWTLHATGTIRVAQATQELSRERLLLSQIQDRCQTEISSTEHYQRMTACGLQYGPSFQGIQQIWQSHEESLARLQVPTALSQDADPYLVHPSLLDACFQLLVSLAIESRSSVAANTTYLPTGIRNFRIHSHPQLNQDWLCYAVGNPDTNPERPELTGDVWLVDTSGQVVIEAQGLRLQCIESTPEKNIADWLYEIQWQPEARLQPATLTNGGAPHQKTGWLIFADEHGVGEALASQLITHGQTCILVSHAMHYAQEASDRYQVNPHQPEDFRRLLEEAFPTNGLSGCRGVVHLWSLDCMQTEGLSFESLEAAQVLSCLSVLHLVQGLSFANQLEARLWLITNGAQKVTADEVGLTVAQSTLWGLGSVIANEHPELRCTRVDLSPTTPVVDVPSLFEEIWSNSSADQVALRHEQRYVARLTRSSVEKNPTAQIKENENRATIVSSEPSSFHFTMTTPGIIDNLAPQQIVRCTPKRGEVEIEVRAVGINFMNIMSALGIYPGYPNGVGPLGIECSGLISALGEGVDEFQVGDEVVAVAFDCLGSHALTDARLVVHKPAQFSFDEAATIPIAFLTASYALNYLGRVAAGERVLIHAATGGVGLAAIQVARQAGAEIFATAGSQEKREYLQKLGIPHVMDSRSLAFASEVKAQTGGEGVDVVLNCLAGEAIAASLSTLRLYGRFLEIGKKDIYQNLQVGLWPFHQNLSYFAIDLERMSRERPGFVGARLQEIMRLFAQGMYTPLPMTVFPASQAIAAFRHMAQARHIGKLVVTVPGGEIQVARALTAELQISSEGSYLITGGLGGLGFEVAKWLQRRGARHLALMGRHEPSGPAVDIIAELRGSGIEVKLLQADVSDDSEVARAFAELKESMPPLKGIVHAAGILDDGVILQMNVDRFRAVLAPKVKGAWNLHVATANVPLDFFVLFSSVFSFLGSPGQGNYAAGNAFLDALAYYRRTLGLPAMSINWGPWARVGLAAAQSNRGERLATSGLFSLTASQGIKALEYLMCHPSPRIAVMPFEVERWRQAHPGAGQSTFFSDLLQQQWNETRTVAKEKRSEAGIRETLLGIDVASKRRDVLESYICHQVAQVLRLSASRIDVNKPLHAIGMDSLMALELRNRLDADLKLKLQATMMWNYPTITAMVPFLASKMNISLDTTVSSVSVSRSPGSISDQVLHMEQIARLSGEEISLSLAAELDEVEELLRKSNHE